jgi:hypothetical protein
MDLKLQYKSLVESLRLLASPYENQKEYLPDFVVVQDEVIAVFRDAFLLLPQLIEADLLSKKAITSIIRCFNWTDMATRNEGISDLESFKCHETWQKVRSLANQALDDMKESKGRPDLGHIDWVD